jgi:hypothetical protein
VLKAVVALGNAGGVESIRLCEIRPSVKVLPVNFSDYIGFSYTQKIVVALQVLWVVAKLNASEILLCQTLLLDHGRLAADLCSSGS